MGKDASTPKIRELFIEELTQVQGGAPGPDLNKIRDSVRELLLTTMACGEEAPC